MSTSKLISSDSHIYEPPDLWERWIEPKFRDRAPFVAHEDNTDQWYADGDWKFGDFNLTNAGLRFENPELLKFEGRYEDVLLGGLNPHAHVKEMDVDGISAGVLYPSHALSIWGLADGELLSACFKAYNSWLADVWCTPYPDRLKGIGMINIDDVDEGIEELERVAKLGLAGAMITLSPVEHRYTQPMYDPLWAAAQDLEMPLSLHTGAFRVRPDRRQGNIQFGDPSGVSNRDPSVRTPIADMIFFGAFERYPKLKVGAIEFEIAWAPYFMDRMDDTYKHRIQGQHITRFKGDTLPSDFFRNNIFIGFQEDDLGIKLRDYVGADNLMWGSDYPHPESTFPRSREIVDRILVGVPEEEKAKIAGGNAAKLYKFP